jgi:RNA polymerase sigma factor (sigma-70 family)
MAEVKKILVTTESHEIFIIRSSSESRARPFCPNCTAKKQMITLDEAVRGSGQSAREVVGRVENGELHFRETDDGGLLICADSLFDEKNDFASRKEIEPKWSLTAEAFDKLLFTLDADREQAGEKYLLLRRNLVRFFEGRAIAEAEEAADEVCNRLARKLEAGATIENINQYAYGVARMLALELYKEKAREQKALNELPKNEILTHDENELRLECLNRCLNDLPAENRELILTYYTGDGGEKIKNRRALAAKLGIPQNALRNRVVRLRDKLKVIVARNLKKQTI